MKQASSWDLTKSFVAGANSELVERARAIVDKAVRQHKIFVVFGQYNRYNSRFRKHIRESIC